MHEFSLADGVLRIVLDTAREHGLDQVSEVRLDVGKLAGVSLDALNFAWEFLREQQEVTAGAALVINQPPGRGECNACGFTGEVTDYIRICPGCGAGGLRFTSGEEFTVTGISGE